MWMHTWRQPNSFPPKGFTLCSTMWSQAVPSGTCCEITTQVMLSENKAFVFIEARHQGLVISFGSDFSVGRFARTSELFLFTSSSKNAQFSISGVKKSNFFWIYLSRKKNAFSYRHMWKYIIFKRCDGVSEYIRWHSIWIQSIYRVLLYLGKIDVKLSQRITWLEWFNAGGLLREKGVTSDQNVEASEKGTFADAGIVDE